MFVEQVAHFGVKHPIRVATLAVPIGSEQGSHRYGADADRPLTDYKSGLGTLIRTGVLPTFRDVTRVVRLSSRVFLRSHPGGTPETNAPDAVSPPPDIEVQIGSLTRTSLSMFLCVEVLRAADHPGMLAR